MKRAFGYFTLLIAVVFALGLGVRADASDALYSGGTGTAADPYLISSGQDLLQLAKESSGGLYYALTQDIALTDPWQPALVFEGVLDGGGYAISGIDIKLTSDGPVGFFGQIGSQAIVANLRLQGRMTVTPEEGASVMAGGLAGRSYGRIENCHSDVHISIASRSAQVEAGGLTGVNDGTVYRCSSLGNVEVTGLNLSVNTGGLIGINRGRALNSYTAGNLSAGEAEICFLGGVIGFLETGGEADNLYWASDALHQIGDNVKSSESKTGIGNDAAGTGSIAKAKGAMAARGFAGELNEYQASLNTKDTQWTQNASLYHGYPYTIGGAGAEDAKDRQPEEEAMPANPTGESEPEEVALSPQPLDLTDIPYLIDEELMLILSPTGEQLRQIVQTAVSDTILIDLSSFIGACGVVLELEDMAWWFDNTGDRLTIMLTTGEAVILNDRMFDNPDSVMSNGRTGIALKQGSLSVAIQQNGADLDWYNPNEPLIVSLPYEIAEAQNPDRLVMIQALEDEAQHIVARSWYEEERVYAKVYSPGDFDIKYSRDVVYADVAGKWMEEAVNYTTARGIIAEKATGFAPNDTVTRVEFVRMFMRLLDVDITDYQTQGFADEYAIPAWGIDSVNKALEMGIVTGDAKGNFNPLEEVTRQDMMVMVYRALDYLELLPAANSTSYAAFSDMGQVKGYAVDAVNTLAAMDLIHGYNGTINPEGVATRAEVVQFFYNVLSWDAVTL